jgi:hypothetical protein
MRAQRMPMRVKIVVPILLALLVSLVGVDQAQALEPWWHVTSVVIPTNLSPGGEGKIWVEAVNVGDESVELPNAPVTLTDVLPSGLTVTAIRGGTGPQTQFSEGECSVASVSCVFNASHVHPSIPESEAIERLVPPYFSVAMEITVKASVSASSAQSTVSVSGGGAVPVSVQRPVSVSGLDVPFGVETYEFTPEEEGGALDRQAGSHPFQLITTLALNNTAATDPRTDTPLISPIALTKDLQFVLPEGFVGNPTPIPQCTDQQFMKEIQGTPNFNECPTSSAVGMASVTIRESSLDSWPVKITEPLFNLVPSTGEPARFGFVAPGVHSPVILDTSVRTGGGYNVTVDVNNITQIVGFVGSEVTFWGVPGDPRHNASRGWWCAGFSHEKGTCTPSQERHPQPLLTLPTSCAGPLQTTISADSWADPGSFTAPVQPLFEQAMEGCGRLSFDPSIQVVPDGQAASTPTGLTVDVHLPQTASLNGSGLAESTVKDTTVVLPAGVALNPAGADGLLSCAPGQIGLQEGSIPTCPEAAKVGTVQITSPLLPDPLIGAAYLAAQNENPFGSLIALYIVAEDSKAGVLVKLAGQVTPDPTTGQLVSTFKSTPQLPFEDLTLHFFGGSRAPLATPALCGPYTTRASVAPWSGNEPVASDSTFQVISGPNGSACSDPLPFHPSLTSGSLNLQAGAFTPFTMTMSREDGEQNLQGIQLHMPVGLLGDLSTVKLCEEPQAQTGECGPESLIGHTVVSVGLGGNPYTVSGGQVFITGPYHGAPYGLSILEPAKAGPFNLGTVVVRAAINVDPTTSALTITSYPLPTIIDGIPLEIRHVNVTVDRPSFTFNPTDCEPTAISGTLGSTEGNSSTINVPFQVTNCATLTFKPIFHVTTNGHTSRANGASLDVKLTYPNSPRGTLANIAKVKVDLPKQLPSRLTTLQKACPDNIFDKNPAACPPGSIVGVAKATTPVLPNTLTGPAYFVSHGGAKFPELIIVLQANGVRVDLHGETFINKQGITSSTFSQIPDVPVGTFELYLPQGPNSALAANGNLCKGTLRMPTAFQAQNGQVIHQTTLITTTGCETKTAHKANRAHTTQTPHATKRIGK